MKTRIIAIAVLGLLLQSYSCKNTSEEKVLTKEVVFTKEGTLTIKHQQTDSLLVSLDIEFAESEYETQTGLMYRKTMDPKQGMLFIFPRQEMKAFYMKNTQFPLDIIFINEKLQIVNTIKNAKPYDKTSLPSEGPAKYVLEVNGGMSGVWGLKAGDVISYEKSEL